MGYILCALFIVKCAVCSVLLAQWRAGVGKGFDRWRKFQNLNLALGVQCAVYTVYTVYTIVCNLECAVRCAV